MCSRPRIAVSILLLALPAFAEIGPVPKTSPPSSQGSVTSSGKFTPFLPGQPPNSAPGRTPAEAEAELLRALKVEQSGSNTFRIGQVVFDKFERTVALPARVAIRAQVVEYALVTEQGKAYESIFTTPARPAEVHLAFLLLGINPASVSGDLNQAAPVPSTNALRIDVAWQADGQSTNLPLADLVSLREFGLDKPGRPMTLERWLYNGSVVDQWGFAAQREGSLIALIRDASALVNNPGRDRDNDYCHLPIQELLPGTNVPVQIILRLPRPPVKPPGPVPLGVTPLTPLSTNYYPDPPPKPR
jgi:hypothetical protein